MDDNTYARRTVFVVTMGCSKNLVDSEVLMRRLEKAGCNVLFNGEIPHNAIVIVNTCGFIGDAKEESINEILRLGQLRQSGHIAELIVMGCLSERYRKELPTQIPEVDKWFGKTDWNAIVEYLSRPNPSVKPYDRVLTTPGHYAYLKIAEGCNRFCGFCTIPIITGRYKSRNPEDVVAEVTMLAKRGVTELNVIAQDLSAYGTDLAGGRSRLAELIDALADVPGIRRIRLHYAYPKDFPMDVLDVMARRPNVCNYLDIALQHSDDKVLDAMRRHITGPETIALLDEIRRRVPGIHIRTTLMVGYPGEGDKEFESLMEFTRTQRFERMGAFAYCEEDDTYAARNLTDNVPDEVKQQRLERLMALQEEISAEIQQQKVGKIFEVVIDREEPENWVGRTEFDSPEVDPEVLIEKTPGISLQPGDYVTVEITEAWPFELKARVLTK